MNQLFNFPEIDGLTLFVGPEDLHKHKVHAHDAYSIIAITSGAKLFHHKQQSLELKTGEIAIANPGELHGCEPIENQVWSHRTCYISKALMKIIAETQDINETIFLNAPVIRDPHLFHSLTHAHTNCTSFEGKQATNILNTLSQLVRKHQLSAIRPKKTKGDERMEIYDDILEKNIDGSIELNELATTTGVKPNTVIRDFKNSSGATPSGYFRAKKLNRAKELIRLGSKFTDVASQSGFSDQSHFTRSFREAFGITPKLYKDLVVQSQGETPL